MIVLGAAGCNVTKPIKPQASPSGTYAERDGVNFNRLVLYPNSSFLYYSPPTGERSLELTYDDTIAYGSWSLESPGFLSLSSPDYLSKRLKIQVEQDVVDHPDTVYIKIDNPVQNYLSGWDATPRHVRYGAAVMVYDAFLQQIDLPNPNNVIKLYNPKRMPVLDIRLVVYTLLPSYDGFILGNYNEGLIAAETETYSVSPISNHFNHFVITIPDLTEQFLIYRRLNRDFVKIIDANQLEWDGHIFKRESDQSSKNDTFVKKYRVSSIETKGSKWQ